MTKGARVGVIAYIYKSSLPNSVPALPGELWRAEENSGRVSIMWDLAVDPGGDPKTFFVKDGFSVSYLARRGLYWPTAVEIETAMLPRLTTELKIFFGPRAGDAVARLAKHSKDMAVFAPSDCFGPGNLYDAMLHGLAVILRKSRRRELPQNELAKWREYFEDYDQFFAGQRSSRATKARKARHEACKAAFETGWSVTL